MSSNVTRVLIVVANGTQRLLIAETLRCAKVEVTLAEDAEAAALEASGGRVDLAIIDVCGRWAGYSGSNLALKLRDQFGVATVFVNGPPDDSAAIHEATAAGALAYLDRAADPRKYLPAIEVALARAVELRKLRETSAQLSEALRQRREISMAVGVLMERHRIDSKAAFERLRSSARFRQLRVHEISVQLLEAMEGPDLSA